MNPDHEVPLSLLDDEQLDQLDQHLSDLAQQDEDVFQLFELLGYISALALLPAQEQLNPQWLGPIESQLEQTPSANAVTQLAQIALERAQQGLYQGGGIELPFQAWDEEQADWIVDWAAGFMQACFEQEEQLSLDDPALAELLLPIMVLSGLFGEEDAEFAEMEEDEPLLEQFVRQLPDLLLDLYCQLNAPEEKAAPVVQKKATAGQKKKAPRRH
ncbi:UPF0149 family protein [Marinospirillum sp. MEB164]|uniref:UPF0149 family protein n=1 Tax=Marinospirillum alkalitolerans TaxID=3123374 RepID=A0ABW8PVJ7_9GAMM